MGRYTDLRSDINLVFASDAWKAETIKILPSSFNGAVSDESLRLNILPQGSPASNPQQSISGYVIIDIFVKAGLGTKRVFEIADKLDDYLVGKTFKTGLVGSTQFLTGTLGEQEIDDDNESLLLTHYSIPFNYFGVN